MVPEVSRDRVDGLPDRRGDRLDRFLADRERRREHEVVPRDSVDRSRPGVYVHAPVEGLLVDALAHRERRVERPFRLAVGDELEADHRAGVAEVADHRMVAERFDGSAEEPFAHGHTFGGNPLSAAIAVHVVDRYTDAVLETGRERGRQLADALDPLRDHPIVGDLRHAGAMIGIEFVADRETKRPFDPSLSVGERVYEEALDRGVYTYPGSGSVDGVAGDHLMLAPPLTIGEASVRTVAAAVREAIDAVADDLEDHVATGV